MKVKHNNHGDCIPWQKKYAWLPTVVLDTKERCHYTIWLEHYRERATFIDARGWTHWSYDRITIDSDINDA